MGIEKPAKGGAIPKLAISIVLAPVAQLDRASAYGAEGWGFKSLQAHKTAIQKP